MNQAKIKDLLEIMQCPVSGGNLEYIKEKNMLYSSKAKVFFPIKEGIPVLLIEEAIKEDDIVL